MPPAASPPPPPAVRRSTAEIDRQSLDLLAANLKQVSEELATERQTRKDDKDKGLSVLKLHVPFLLWFATVGMLVGVGTTASLFVHETKAHIGDKTIHVDPQRIDASGGFVFKNELNAAISDVNDHSRAALRAIVNASPITCGPIRRNEKADCKFGAPVVRE